MAAKFIYTLEELNKDDGDLVGKKCANLGELTRAGFHVPPGFALTLEAYDEFLRETGLQQQLSDYFSGFSADPTDPKELRAFGEAAKHVQATVEATKISGEMAGGIVEHYRGLCRKSQDDQAKVAVRSAGPASHPGQYDSFLNVCGEEDVLANVVKVWSSTFNTRSLVARARKGLPLERDPIGVCVLRMVNARAAGVMFTAEPTTADVTKLTLEGSWGLGESVVSGSVIPDVWMVDRTKFAIMDRRVNPTPAAASEPGCLTDDEVIQLARIGAEVETHFGTPQDIEWAVDSEGSEDPYYVLQTRNEKFSIRFAGF